MLVKEEEKNNIVVQYYSWSGRKDRISALNWAAAVAMDSIWSVEEIELFDKWNRSEEDNESEWLSQISHKEQFVSDYKDSKINEIYITGFYQEKELTVGIKLDQGYYTVIFEKTCKECVDRLLEKWILKG